MEFPRFVTKELFEKAFRTYFNNTDVCIEDYQSKWAVPPGDNYTSDLLRSNITYKMGKSGESKTMSVVVKISPETRDGIVNTVKEMRLFQKEIEMYTKILPEIHKILGNLGTLSPQCLYAEDHPVPLLILQDLSLLGYKMSSRREGLDLEHCLLVMKKIAQLHASSFIIHKKNPKIFSNYNESMFSGHPFVVHWVNTSIECIVKACKERPGMRSYVTKLEKLKDNFFEKCGKATKPKAGDFNVLTHGDCWTNNCMFLYDADGKLSDLRLIDFQLGVYTGPSVDLQYFWNTTPKMSVFTQHLDTVLTHYYNELVSTLIKLGNPTDQVPSKLDIYKDFYLKGVYGFAGAVTALPMIKSDFREDASLEELLKPLEIYEGSFCEHVYTNELSWKYFEHVFPFLDELGVFD